MTASIKAGLRAAVRHPKLVWLLWAWYGLLALVPALPAWTWWNGVLGSSPEAASVLKRFDLGVFLDVTAGKGINGLGLLAGAALGVAIVASVSSAFAFGGILEAFGTDDDRRPFMHRFFRGGGHFFWRFFRLAVIAGVCLVFATGAVAGLMSGVTAPLSDSEWEPAGYLAGIASVLVLLAVAALFLLALDYARIRVARDDSRSMLKAYASGLGFVLRRLFTVYGIAIAILIVEVALVLCYVAYETNAPAAGTWAAIAALLIIQQTVVFGRVFLRVALIGAERHFHETTVPAAVAVGFAAIEGPVSPVPDVAGQPEPAGSPALLLASNSPRCRDVRTVSQRKRDASCERSPEKACKRVNVHLGAWIA
jgi:hypothetical protein